MFKNLIKDYKVIVSLALSDFKKRFVGSYFGVLWMFIQPLSTIAIYTFVFQVGFKAIPPVANIPYVLWLLPGIIPWFYFQDNVLQGTNVLNEYQFLVKKVVFNTSYLPIIKLISTFLAHLCFLIILFIIMTIFNRSINISYLLVLYYSFSISVLSLGLTYITSSINVFFKDMMQIVSIGLNFGMWLTPIMYSETIFINKHPFILKLLKLNPLYYIIKGFRSVMINEEFDNYLLNTIYYWCFAIIVLFIGIRVFNKLKNHFSDVL